MIVAGVGARTPLGLTSTQTGFLGRAGMVSLQEAPLPDGAGQAFTMGLVSVVPRELRGTARLEALTGPALEELFSELGQRLSGSRLRLHLLADEPLGAFSVDVASLEFALRQQASALHGSNVAVEVHATGTGGGAAILATIQERLQQGVCDAVLFGGAHTDVDPCRIEALTASDRIFSPDNRDGLVPGEGAAFVLLTLPATARALGLPVRAVIQAFSPGFETARPDNDHPAFEAKGLTVAVRRAMTSANAQSGWLMNDLNTELFRLYEYQAVLARSQDLLCPPQVMEAPAQRLGDQGAASLPLHLVLAAEAWRRGYAPCPRLLTTTGSDSGARTAVVVAQPT